MTRLTGLQTATKLTLAANTPTELKAPTALSSTRLNLTVQSGAALLLGGANVNAANGFPLPANTPLSLDSSGGVFGFIVAGGDVNILEGS